MSEAENLETWNGCEVWMMLSIVSGTSSASLMTRIWGTHSYALLSAGLLSLYFNHILPILSSADWKSYFTPLMESYFIQRLSKHHCLGVRHGEELRSPSLLCIRTVACALQQGFPEVGLIVLFSYYKATYPLSLKHSISRTLSICWFLCVSVAVSRNRNHTSELGHVGQVLSW